MLRKFYSTVLGLLIAVVFSVTTAHAGNVFFELHGDDPTAGDDLDLVFDTTVTTFSLDVYLLIGDNEDGDGIYSANHTIYVDDTTIASITGGSVNTDLWDPSWSWIKINDAGDADGIISDYDDNTGQYPESQAAGTLLLETITFTLSGETGTTTLRVEDWDPEWDDDFTTWDWLEIDQLISFNGATVSVVPVPSTLMLLGFGLAGLVGFKRKMLG